MKTISVVMATFNRLNDLHSCFKAIEQQVGTFHVQVCVVNDGGPSIRPIVEDFRDLDIVYRDELVNEGQVAARMKAMQLAEGTYIAFCDDDDRWLPNHLHDNVEILDEAGALWSYSDTELVRLRNQNDVSRLLERRHFAWKDAGALLRKYNPIVPSSVVYRADIHRDLGDFDIELGHYWDWDLWLRLASFQAPVRVPRCDVLYGLHDDGSNQSANPGQMRPDLMRLIEKHRLGLLPSMNFWTMLDSQVLRGDLASTDTIWNGDMNIWVSTERRHSIT